MKLGDKMTTFTPGECFLMKKVDLCVADLINLGHLSQKMWGIYYKDMIKNLIMGRVKHAQPMSVMSDSMLKDMTEALIEAIKKALARTEKETQE